MKQHQIIVDKFSKFLIVEERQGYLTITNSAADLKLKANMEKLVELQAETTEEFWALYWLKAALNSSPTPLAKWHLSAYLDQTCYWVSVGICRQFSCQGLSPMESFLIGRNFTCDATKLFGQKYNSHLCQVKTYAQMRLKTQILEELRRRKEMSKPRSDWSLLRSLTSTSLQKALLNYGYKDLASYQLAWRCFKEIYTPTAPGKTKQLSPPTMEQWEAITGRYNQLRASFKLESSIQVEELQKQLKLIIQAVRKDSINPLTVACSLDEVNTPDPALISSSVYPIQPEKSIPEIFYFDISNAEQREVEWFQVNSILSQAFLSVPQDIQKMLTLWLGLELNQKDVASLFGWTQDKFSKKMKPWKHFFAKHLLENLKDDRIEQSLNGINSNQINKIIKQIDIWMSFYLKNPYHEFLQTLLVQELQTVIPLLKLYYGQQLSLEDLATQLNLGEPEIRDRLGQTHIYLQEKLTNYIEAELQTSLGAFFKKNEQIREFIDDFLVNAPYAKFSSY